MSQYLPDGKPPVPIERYDQLVGYFEEAYRPRSEWLIGTEYEKIPVRIGDGHAVPFAGPNGIEDLLRRMAQRYGWEPVREGEHVVALRRGAASITLEPGAQLELSGEPWSSVHEAAAELRRHVEEIAAVGAELQIAFLGLGMQPLSTLEQIGWVPKQRYRIMAPYMRRVGTLGQRMMKQTASVQVNVDFCSEADAMTKMRVGTAISPLLAAMFANSPLSDGALNGFMTYRGHIWTDTDSKRSGLLHFVLGDSAGFADYVEYALDVPMYFIVREGWIDMTSLTFRRFLDRGHEGYRATIDDWNTHLTTLFPEVRLKKYIELRSVDCQLPELALAVPALIKGLLYDPGALAAAWDLVKGWSWEERLELCRQVHRRALAASIRGIRLAELAAELLEMARHGLRQQRRLDQRGEDESLYLEPLTDFIRRGSCPAQQVRERWLGEWNQDIHRLIAETAYTPEAAIPAAAP